MKIASTQGSVIQVELTRRNLETLLAKLDDPTSMKTIYKTADDGQGTVFVSAVENEKHYSDRPAGPVLIDGVMI